MAVLNSETKRPIPDAVAVGTLEGGYICNVPLPRIPRVQSASHMTGPKTYVSAWESSSRVVSPLEFIFGLRSVM